MDHIFDAAVQETRENKRRDKQLHPNQYLVEAMNEIQFAEEMLSSNKDDKYKWHIEKLMEAHSKLRLVASQLAKHYSADAPALTDDIEVPRTKPPKNWKAYE